MSPQTFVTKFNSICFGRDKRIRDFQKGESARCNTPFIKIFCRRNVQLKEPKGSNCISFHVVSLKALNDVEKQYNSIRSVSVQNIPC